MLIYIKWPQIAGSLWRTRRFRMFLVAALRLHDHCLPFFSNAHFAVYEMQHHQRHKLSRGCHHKKYWLRKYKNTRLVSFRVKSCSNQEIVTLWRYTPQWINPTKNQFTHGWMFYAGITQTELKKILHNCIALILFFLYGLLPRIDPKKWQGVA